LSVVLQAINAAIFIAFKDLVASFSGNTKLTAQTNHLLAIQ